MRKHPVNWQLGGGKSWKASRYQTSWTPWKGDSDFNSYWRVCRTLSLNRPHLYPKAAHSSRHLKVLSSRPFQQLSRVPLIAWKMPQMLSDDKPVKASLILWPLFSLDSEIIYWSVTTPPPRCPSLFTDVPSVVIRDD